ncbi:MAG: hypothetical protein KatS3mg039_0612 [Candidatus Kapaibacterium sp.]|nr:MAG: hypothetical protein KatS3mg039_0612 [Candidatus Kapabacteria bacterium]
METLHLEIGTHWLWLAGMFLAIVVATVWYYHRHRALLTARQRVTLSVLRSLGLGLLAVVLLMPVVRMVSSHRESPRVAVLVDNSASMALRDGRFDRAALVRRALEGIQRSFPTESILAYRFGRTAEQLAAFVRDSFRLDEPATNLELPLTMLADRRDENVQAVVLVTDGAYNTGGMPLYAAESFGKPVFAVGVGDTVPVKDVALTSIVTSERGYKGVELPVHIGFTADGVEADATVVLSENGTEVARTTVHLSPSQRFYRTVLAFTPKAEGVRKLTAHLQPVTGEYTTLNNTRSEFVTILPNERRIALIAGSPSPDVAFITQLLSTDRSIRLQPFIQKFGAEFYGAAPTAADLRAAESIVLVGFPIASSPENILALIAEEARRGKPILFVASSGIDSRKLGMLEPFLPFTIERWGTAEMQVTCQLTDRGASHALMQVGQSGGDVWNTLPPIFRPEVFISPKPGAEVLANIKVGTTTLDEPLILARTNGNQRTVALLGYGLYRWKLLGEGMEASRGGRSTSVLQSFLDNTLRWLASNENAEKVRIRTSKRHYTSGEPVEFIADVHDDALHPIDDAVVSVTVRRSDQQFDVVLQPTGNGRYLATLASLSGGDYAFTGKVMRGSQLYGTDVGRFTVGEIALEYQNLRMNAELLRVLAERTGGAFVTADQFDAAKLWARIESLPTFQPRIITEARTIAVWNHWLLLALAIAALALEWYLRKRFGVI